MAMNKHVRSYQLWYEFLCRSDNSNNWDSDVLQAFGDIKMPADKWWQKMHDSFPTTDRAEVSVIEDPSQIEPNDEYVFNVEVYFHHPKHRLMKAFKKLVDAEQKKWNVKTSEEFIQVTNFPLCREVNKSTIKSLETTLRVWDAYKEIEQENKAKGISKKPDLYEVWKRARTEDSLVFKDVDDKNVLNETVNRETVRPHISRYLKWAEIIIANAQKKVFPSFVKNANVDKLPTISKIYTVLESIDT